jgi:hypothetical protein
VRFSGESEAATTRRVPQAEEMDSNPGPPSGGRDARSGVFVLRHDFRSVHGEAVRNTSGICACTEVRKNGRAYWRLRTPDPGGTGFSERQFVNEAQAQGAFDLAYIQYTNYGLKAGSLGPRNAGTQLRRSISCDLSVPRWLTRPSTTACTTPTSWTANRSEMSSRRCSCRVTVSHNALGPGC